LDDGPLPAQAGGTQVTLAPELGKRVTADVAQLGYRPNALTKAGGRTGRCPAGGRVGYRAGSSTSPPIR
jgi:hypothetical protein